MTPRSQLSKEVQTRLAAGESKADVYTALKSKFNAGAVERSLAQWPLPALKQQAKQMNVPLIIIAVFFTLLRILTITPVFNTLAPAQMAAAGLIVMVHLYTIYGVAFCNLIGYMLLILMGINNILNVVQVGFSDSKMIMVLGLSAAGIGLALIQKRKLFPNTSWFLRHKRDSAGNPIF